MMPAPGSMRYLRVAVTFPDRHEIAGRFFDCTLLMQSRSGMLSRVGSKDQTISRSRYPGRLCASSRRLASRGMEVAGMEPRAAVRRGRVPSAEAKAMRRRIVWHAQLVVSSAIPIMGTRMVFGERRRGNGGGKNYHCTKCTHVDHCVFSVPLWARSGLVHVHFACTHYGGAACAVSD